MKRNVLASSVTALLLAIANQCLAQNKACAYAEVQSAWQNNAGQIKTKPQIKAGYDTCQNHGLGAWLFALAKKDFGEVYAGPSYELAPWAKLGVAGGLQTQGLFQSGSFLYLGNEYLSLFAIGELDTHYGYNYKAVATARPIAWLGLGVYEKRFEGLGPYAELRLKPTLPVTLWSALLPYDPEASQQRTKLITALKFYF